MKYGAASALTLALCLGACLSCGSSPGHEIHTGGGILLYWDADLRKLPSAPGSSTALLAASVTGLQTVEVLRVSPNKATATAMPATPTSVQGCGRTPGGLGAYTDASGTDIAVEDSCGNYVIHGATASDPTAAGWNPTWTAQTTGYVETSQDVSGQWILAFDNSRAASFFRQDSAGKWQALGQLPVPAFAGAEETRVVLPVAGNVWAIQDGGEIDLVDLGSVGPLTAVTMQQDKIVPPNLVRYQGYDHMTGIPGDACPHTLIGVAVLGNVRPLVAIDLAHPGNGLYSTAEFGSSGFDAITVAAVSLPDGSTLLGSIGTANGSTVFKAFRMQACGLPQQVAKTPAEFDFKTAPLPAFGPDVHQPRTDGAKLVGWDDAASGVATFAHYDGYDLRLFHVQKQSNGWKAWQETRTLHETRTDYSAPAR